MWQEHGDQELRAEFLLAHWQVPAGCAAVECAGKRRSTRVRKSGTWLKTTLVAAAWAAARKKDSYLRSQFLRLKARRGPKKAILAVAASMLSRVLHAS